ncbi:Uncharacterised protein [Bordetella pertussis]|nr:Uncharacterised protein [Bordetella pertussis]
MPAARSRGAASSVRMRTSAATLEWNVMSMLRTPMPDCSPIQL